MKYLLEELVDLKIGRTPPRKEQWWFSNTSGVKWVSIKDMGDSGRFIDNTSEFLVKDSIDKFNIPIVKKGTVILSFKLTVGRVSITQDDMLTNEAIAQLPVKDEKILNPMFLYYYLKSYNFNQLGSTSSIAQAINSKYLKKMEIDIPEISMQNKIVDILSSIDSYIECNQKINNNLEQQAQAIFKSWFIDFDPFDGIRPSDWIIGTIDNLGSEIICGKTPSTKKKEYYGSDMPFITIPDMHGCVYNVVTEKYLSIAGIASQSKKTLPPNSVCVSCIGTAGLVTLVSEKSQTNQQINAITPKEGISPYYVYLLMKTLSKIINKLGQSGSTIVNLNKKQFSKIQVIIPSRSILCNFDILCTPLFEMILSNQRENIRLVNLRDILLTKLMKGELDVSNINL